MANASRKPSFSLDPFWPQYGAAGLIALTFVLGVLRLVLFDWTDPRHCGALLSTGQWLDGDFKNWQPDGCMMRKYQPKNIETCMKSRRVVFVGDSRRRETPRPRPPLKLRNRLQFPLAPFLNTSITHDILQGNANYAAADQPRDTQPPLMLVLGTGLWYLRHFEPTKGLRAWSKTIESTFSAISKAGSSIASTVVFLPVQQVVVAELNPDRAASIHPSNIDAMNSDLSHLIAPPTVSLWSQDGSFIGGGASSSPPLPIAFPLAFNDMLDASQSSDGLHFSNAVIQAQVNVLLNYKCNEGLPVKFPRDHTCCRAYPTPSYIQLFVLFVVVAWGPIARFGRSYISESPPLSLSLPNPNFWLCRRPKPILVNLFPGEDIWLKEQKDYDPWIFSFLALASLAAGLATMKSADKDLGFLNREQTDEWKGWMQIAILIYHYLGASKVSGIYNPIRALVAAYLFMSGYGHTTFYLKKADFGFLRIMQVMVRLNLLTVVLAYTMNTDYLSYYFAPLVSYWFFVIWVTLYLGKAYNTNTTFLLLKIAASMAFRPQPVLQHQMECEGVEFRVSLDLWIVYSGILSAIAYIKFRELRLGDHPRWPNIQRGSLILAAITMVWYFGFELTRVDKFDYNAWHPFVAVLPVLAFVALRNANVKLRGASSKVFAFIGTCSLETFILQYHIWLAADTKGILLVIPGTRWRPLNLVVSTIIFIYLSYKVANATGELTTWICGSKKGGAALPTAAPASSSRPAPQSAPAASGEEAIPLTSKWTVKPPSLQRRALESSALAGFNFGLPVKLAVFLVALWILNMLWPDLS
ncbi:Cas1p-domain-containing protein [Auriculariales sp. MPI-PUGE-AT-0066]|nr:Cas1p-domain-containing protein [Auriculariales sp. MPI-PUGE-AT-0066]